SHRGRGVHAVGPVERLRHQRHRRRAAAAEDKGRDRHALGILVRRVGRRALADRRREAAIGMGRLLLAAGLPVVALPVDGVLWRLVGHAFPHTSPSSVSATFVKMVFSLIDAMALGLVFSLVPGATPKKPASGLIAYNRPSAPGLIQAMSSPTVVTSQPSFWNSLGGTSMAKFVLPHADGNAAATYVFVPSGAFTPVISMCSA